MQTISIFLSALLGVLLLTGSAVQAQNLALHKTVTSSSAVQSAANAVDGSGDTRWESASSDNQQITIDLGTTQAIDRVRLTWENAYGKDFTVQVSNDAMVWTPVANVTNNATTYNDFTNLATSARYVKMAGTARATGYGYSLYEFEVFSTSPNPASNLALGKTAYASSAQGGFEMNMAFDGNNTSRWGSIYSDNQWLYVDLGRPANITQVNLIWETAYGKNFHIDVSDDATTWTPIKTLTNNTVHVNELAVTATGRYVRMYGVTRGTGYGFSLYEFQVNGSFVQPLPVELIAFQAATAGTGVALSWGTASEQANRGFEVERSADGQTFAALAWVAGVGASQSAHRYSYYDAKPLSTLVSYYRLKQVDTDGQAVYSPVRVVRYVLAPVITVFPNPTTDRVHVTWPASEGAITSWCLTNVLGQVLATKLVAGSQDFTVDLLPCPAGSYYLTVLAGEQVLGCARVQKAP